jgi:hypothetical protein
MVSDSLATIFPWFMAGCSAYFVVSLVILEPVLIFRFFYSLIGGFFLVVYFDSAGTAAYKSSNAELIVLTAFLSIGILFSAYRLRKGEM